MVGLRGPARYRAIVVAWVMATTAPHDPLADFTRSPFTAAGATHDVLRAGSGPCVLVLPEVPGVTPNVAGFARHLVQQGFSVAMPVLFGTAGAPPTGAAMARTMLQVCVSREFSLLATRSSSPITSWLRALAVHEHERCGGPGTGVVGMCLTGGFGLAMAVEPAVLAPVLSQPSLPVAGLPGVKGREHELGISDADLATVRTRAEEEGLCVLGLRFTGDKLVPAQRFARLRAELGDAFLAVELDSSPGNPHGHPTDAHSVLTEHLDATTRDRVVSFLGERLRG